MFGKPVLTRRRMGKSWRTVMKILRPEEAHGIPLLWRELTPEELREAYALARASFTAEDLQRFTEIEEDIPAENVLAEMEEAQKKADQTKQ